MTRVEVVAVSVCALCKGAKVVPVIEGGSQTYVIICPTCGGTGETRAVVTCGGCRWFDAQDDLCCHPDFGFFIAEPTHACASWQGKETT